MKDENWELVEIGNSLPIKAELETLTYTELRILKLMLDPEFIEMTVKDKCEFAQVSKDSWYRAMKKPIFVDALNQLAIQIIRDNSTKLVQATVKFALKGSFQHMKLALEAGGIIQTQTGLEVGEMTIRFVDPRAKAIEITEAE